MKTSEPLTPHLPPRPPPRLLQSGMLSVTPMRRIHPFTLLPKHAADCPIRSLFSNNSRTITEIKFGGRTVYSRTVEEVERAAQELLEFVEVKKRKEDQCIFGLDIEWRPTFRRGVAPGKAAVLQICGENSCCYVLHIIHSQIPKSLQRLLEDQTSLKVGVAIANDAAKVSQDYNVSIKTLEDLSDLANRKLGGEPKKWSLSTLTEMLTCRQLPKPNKIRLGNWEVAVLSQEQLNYAATDAYVSWYLYQVLKNLPDPPENKSEEIVVPPNDLISSTGIW
ncbi:Werner Syndrome-like exonuclease isoform X3 [Sesamum indicum]|uniref:3'-5' exonuclease n=1 Tax=Sesamum indicum TaxID=4182 RepID=A0A6I9TLW9_SESIN|nr:Werner Syndrome-like exonuclease isoform X3 [Sesamum indicum]